MSTARPVDVARMGLGLLALTRPGLVLRLGTGPGGRGERVTVRVLGARYVLQSGSGLLLALPPLGRRVRTWDHPWVRDVDAAVDLVHAGTMLALAAARPGHRRLALTSAAAATAFALADLQERLR
jgi:hypothetical protein